MQHSPGFLALVTDATPRIRECTVADVRAAARPWRNDSTSSTSARTASSRSTTPPGRAAHRPRRAGARHRDPDPRQGRRHRPLLRRRVPLGAGGGQPAEDGLHATSCRWTAASTPGARPAMPSSPATARADGRARPAVTLAAVRAAIVACDDCPRLRRYCAAHRAGEEGGPPRRHLLGAAGAGVRRSRRRACCWSGWRRRRTAPTAPGACSPATVGLGRLPARARCTPPGSPTSRPRASADDGLTLRDAYILSAVRCAPPDNKPTPDEIARCRRHLTAEIAALPRVRVVVALGKIGHDAYLAHLAETHGVRPRPRPAFGHGSEARLGAGLPVLLGCYHPSRQNTNTGKLTPAYDAGRVRARARCSRSRERCRRRRSHPTRSGRPLA